MIFFLNDFQILKISSFLNLYSFDEICLIFCENVTFLPYCFNVKNKLVYNLLLAKSETFHIVCTLIVKINARMMNSHECANAHAHLCIDFYISEIL